MKNSQLKTIFWSLVRLLIVISIFILLVRYQLLDLIILKKILMSSWIIFALICFFISLSVLVIRWRLLLNAVDIFPSFKEVFKLTFIGYAFSTVIPGGVSGDIVKAYYLIKGQLDKRTSAVATIMLDRVIGLFTMITIAAFSIIIVQLFSPQLLQNTDQGKYLKIFGIILFSIASIIVIIFSLFLNKSLYESQFIFRIINRLPAHQIIKNFYSTIHSFRKKKQVISQSLLISIIAQFLFIICMYLIGQAAGEYNLKFGHYLFLSPIASMLNSIPIGPGGLGSGEAFIEWLFMLFGSQNGGEIIGGFHFIFILFSLIGFTIYIRNKKDYIDYNTTISGK